MENTKDLALKFEAHMQQLEKSVKFCSVCGMSMRGEICEACIDRKTLAAQEAEKKKTYDIERLGGLRAYEDYHAERLDNRFYDARRAIALTCGAENLYLWGPRGTGKTHLAVALIRMHPQGRLLKLAVVMRELKEAALDSRREQSIIDRYVNHPQLCLDDLGAEKLTPHTRSLLYEIIDGRWANKKGGLVVTSNFSLEELSAHLEDDRIVSRIAGMSKIIRLAGDDRRIVKGEAK